MTTLLLDRRGLTLKREGGTLALFLDGQRHGTVPLHLVERVVMRSSVQLDSGLLAHLANSGVGVLMIGGRHGRKRAVLTGVAHNDAARRIGQYRRYQDADWCADWARRLVHHKAERLYPLRRLSRILVQRRVEWALEALLACAERGISVVFFDDDGEVMARLLGKPGVRDELYHRLGDFLMLPQAGAMYRYWCDDFRRKAARWAGLKLGVPAGERDPVACRNWINRQVRYLGGDQTVLKSHQWLRAVAYDWMEGHLQDLGFGRQNELARSGEPALARDLAEIFVWYLEPAYLGWLKRRCLAARRKGEDIRPPNRRDLVRLFESRAARAAARGREITSLLHRWLIHNS